MKHRVCIADDEPLVRERLRTLLAERNDVELVGESADGESALHAIRSLQPDIALLDVQMPELDGFEVVDALPPDSSVAIIFVTAYHEYAVRAFDINAIDYLLKPIEPARFHAAIDRARTRMAGPGARETPQLAALLTELRALRGYGERLVVRDGQRISFVAISDIDTVEAARNYVRIHAGRTRLLMRESMKSVEQKLDPRRFMRVHRSVIVNIDRIAHVEPHFHGEYVLTLRDGRRLTTSRSFSDRVRSLLA